MKIALEGPINKCSDQECIDWREKVKDSIDGVMWHDPMDLDCRGREKEMEKFLIHFDTVGIASSDIVFVMAEKPGWGTAMAVQMAWEQHKTVVSVCSSETPSPWLKNRSTYMVKTLDDGIALLKTLVSVSS